MKTCSGCGARHEAKRCPRCGSDLTRDPLPVPGKAIAAPDELGFLRSEQGCYWTPPTRFEGDL